VTPMHCEHILDHFSDYYDGVLPADTLRAFEEHRVACPSCDRYLRVLRAGTERLRALPLVTPDPGFRARLRHSILVEEEVARRERLSPSGWGSAGKGLLLAAAAIAAAVTAPLLFESSPDVVLAPVVAEAPIERLVRGPLPARPNSPPVAPFLERSLWTGSNALLFEVSALANRRGSDVVQAGLR